MTGDELKSFVDGALIPRLKNLDVSSGNKRALIVREIFDGTNNYMKNEQAWKVSMDTISSNGYNLDIKNPHVPEEEQSHSSAEIVSMLRDSFRKSGKLLEKLKKEIGNG